MPDKIRNTLLAALLCACLIMTGSMRPFFAYASLVVGGEEQEEESDEPDEKNAVEEKYQGRIDDINEKLKDLEKQKKELQESISNVKDEKERAIQAKNSIDREIAITQGEIAALQERITLLELDILEKQKNIEDKQKDIENKQKEIDDSYKLLKKRLRVMYMQDTTTTLGLLVGAESFSDLLTRTEYIKRIADHDRDLLQKLTDQRVDIENEKVSLENDKDELLKGKDMIEADKTETKSKEQYLSVQSSKAQLQIQDIAEMERAYLADLEKNKKIQAQAQAELDQIFKEIEWSKNPYVGGEMAWPVPGYYQISSYYGPRFGGADYHTGMDITGSGVHGKNIVAANAGTVVKVNYAYTQGVGYGIFVMLDHGGNVSTLYGHCSKILVTVGDEVKKGQAIAQVGSTGWSTGPHLHFEVRVNNKHVNPLPYVQGK